MRKTRPAESFFNFFSPPEPPSEDLDEDEVDEDELGDLEERLELDYQIGEDLKELVSQNVPMRFVPGSCRLLQRQQIRLQLLAKRDPVRPFLFPKPQLHRL